MDEKISKGFLEAIEIASPCNVAWDEMSGNERTRFCGSCEKNVFNLSEMNRFEAEQLIRQQDGRICIRMYRRSDGTVITDDCPVGLRMLKRGYKTIYSFVGKSALRMAAGLSAIIAVFLSISDGKAQNSSMDVNSTNGCDKEAPNSKTKTLEKKAEKQPFKLDKHQVIVGLVMPPRTTNPISSAVDCESVVVAEYQGYEENGGPVTLDHPPKANFKITELLKGAPFTNYRQLPIRYEIDQTIKGSKKDGWEFDKSMMPEIGSKWILLIPNTVPIDGMFETLRSASGRQEANQENLDKVRNLLKQPSSDVETSGSSADRKDK